jgi:hypothetical protein
LLNAAHRKHSDFFIQRITRSANFWRAEKNSDNEKEEERTEGDKPREA